MEVIKAKWRLLGVLSGTSGGCLARRLKKVKRAKKGDKRPLYSIQLEGAGGGRRSVSVFRISAVGGVWWHL